MKYKDYYPKLVPFYCLFTLMVGCANNPQYIPIQLKEMTRDKQVLLLLDDQVKDMQINGKNVESRRGYKIFLQPNKYTLKYQQYSKTKEWKDFIASMRGQGYIQRKKSGTFVRYELLGRAVSDEKAKECEEMIGKPEKSGKFYMSFCAAMTVIAAKPIGISRITRYEWQPKTVTFTATQGKLYKLSKLEDSSDYRGDADPELEKLQEQKRQAEAYKQDLQEIKQKTPRILKGELPKELALPMGEKAYHREAYQEARSLLLFAADQGSSSAEYLLGNIFYQGNGVDQDKDEALKWYKKSALQGNSDAVFKLYKAYDIRNVNSATVNPNATPDDPLGDKHSLVTEYAEQNGCAVSGIAVMIKNPKDLEVYTVPCGNSEMKFECDFNDEVEKKNFPKTACWRI